MDLRHDVLKAQETGQGLEELERKLAEARKEAWLIIAGKVEFVEAGLAALRFQLQVWSLEHLGTAGTFKSDLNFEVWRQLAVAGVTIREPTGSMVLGLQLATTPKQ
jgi:hypothetical protein